MESFIRSIARESLLLVSSQKLIQSFQINEVNQVIVFLLDGTSVEQTAETTIAFCRGLLEGVKISDAINLADDI